MLTVASPLTHRPTSPDTMMLLPSRYVAVTTRVAEHRGRHLTCAPPPPFRRATSPDELSVCELARVLKHD